MMAGVLHMAVWDLDCLGRVVYRGKGMGKNNKKLKPANASTRSHA
jgi:hypothetical protein